jgi:hypothetical protein
VSDIEKSSVTGLFRSCEEKTDGFIPHSKYEMFATGKCRKGGKNISRKKGGRKKRMKLRKRGGRKERCKKENERRKIKMKERQDGRSNVMTDSAWFTKPCCFDVSFLWPGFATPV